MAQAGRTLDTSHRQVLVKYPDEDLQWHHRVLLEPGGAGQWVCATPDLEVQLVDLAGFSAGFVRPLRRHALFPDCAAEGLYCFDPVTDAEMAQMKEEAQNFAGVLGFAATAAATGRWVIADAGSAQFGQEVPPAALGDDEVMVVRGSKALVCIGDSWLHAEQVPAGGDQSWKQARWAGAARDPRVSGLSFGADGQSQVEEQVATGLWRAPDKGPTGCVPLQGPRMAHEWFNGLRLAGRSIVAHDAEWRHRSGVPEQGMASRFHTAISEILRCLVCVDQLDVNHTIGPELCTRVLYVVEAACDRNPRQPDWEGLEGLLSFSVSTRGVLEVPCFATWVSQGQASKVAVLKQGRLIREERRSDRKAAKGEGKGKEKKEEEG